MNKEVKNNTILIIVLIAIVVVLLIIISKKDSNKVTYIQVNDENSVEVNNRQNKEVKDGKYKEISMLTDRLSDSYVAIYKVVSSNERLGTNEDMVNSELYNNNEGWLLTNLTTYCSNRIVDNIGQISLDTKTNLYQADGGYVSIEAFKNNLIRRDEICVNMQTSDLGEQYLESTLFIGPEHKIYAK